ncbi:hypothetical protein BFS14_04180 [Serratia fonticola]|nr:hypothetical protein BFS14_04180 [Serratia fonticola]
MRLLGSEKGHYRLLSQRPLTLTLSHREREPIENTSAKRVRASLTTLVLLAVILVTKFPLTPTLNQRGREPIENISTNI